VIVLNDDTGLPQPLLTVYVILEVPADNAETTPVPASRVGKGEFHPQTSHGTVLDSLPSHGSSNSRNHFRLTGTT